MNKTAITLNKPLVLVGMMGVGKTSAGIVLATRNTLPFHDSDEVLEQESGMDTGNIFSAFGEGMFREMEYRTIEQLVAIKPHPVISAGGGAFVQEKTRELIQTHATSVWLDMEITALVERLRGDNNAHRPLLQCGDVDKRVKDLCELRAPLYAQADHRIDVTHIALKDVVEKIEALIS